ncbi:MAG TPA: hypothetical protein VGP44_10680, partial [Gemmatimonadales bacterium]|nr:hypothetical protein [Gemmatimonadales bacterium]
MSNERRLGRRTMLAAAAAAAAGVVFRPRSVRADSGPASSETVPVVFASNPSDGWELAIDKDGDAGVISRAGESAAFNPPPVRLRVSRPDPDPSGGKHLLVVPYKYGMAIEYDGVLECWVQDFSVHNHGPSEGARFWVG